MHKIKILALFLLILFVTSFVSAADHYIRQGASGTTCSDWTTTNACNDLPATLVRGDTYYLADGTYASKTLDTPNNLTKTITIMKAIGATGQTGHGTDVGWQNTYGDGQALIPQFIINTSYWTIDGQKGDGFSVLPADDNKFHYGIWFTNTYQNIMVGSNGPYKGGGPGTSVTDITIKHVYSATDVSNWQDAGGGFFFGMHSSNYQASVSNLTISHCFFYGWGQVLVMSYDNQWSNVLWEYNIHEQMYTSQTYGAHGNPINALWAPVTNLTVRYSLFYGTYGDGGLSEVISANGSIISNSKFYGNVFDQAWSGRAIIGGNGPTSSNGDATIKNTVSYNNTFLHSGLGKPNDGGGVAGDERASGNIFQNNLVYDTSAQNKGGVTGSYNEYVHTVSAPELEPYSIYISADIDPFTNWSRNIYTLKRNSSSKGIALGTEFSYDALGHQRTSWTRGAFEFGGADQNILYVTKSGAGAGTVTSVPAGISCGVDCDQNFSRTTSVTLTAVPTGNNVFVGWSGACTNSSGTCTVSVTGSVNVDARFALPLPTVSNGTTLSVAVDTPLDINVISAGDYRLVGSVQAGATDGGANSFYIDIGSDPGNDITGNGDDTRTWDINYTTPLNWNLQNVTWKGPSGVAANCYIQSCAQYNPKIFNLSLGANTLYVNNREAGAQIQSITFLKITTANNPPSVTVGTDKSSYVAPTTVVIDSNASDLDGYISRVDFYNGTMLIGTDGNAPYQYIWGNVPAGSYTLKATAIDGEGASTSATTSIIVTTAVGNTFHPADTGKNWDINGSEYAAYGACFKNPAACTNYNGTGTGVNTADYINASNIWNIAPQNYHNINGSSCPPNHPSTCWVPGSS